MSTIRLRRVGMACVLLCGQAVWGQAARPVPSSAGKAEAITLPGDERQLREELERLAKELPQLPTTPTAQQETNAVRARAVYREACKRLDGLSKATKSHLGYLGMVAGFSAGEPDTLLSGAKLFWPTLEPGKAHTGYAQWMVWAGILAGDPAAAKVGLDHIAKHPGDEGLARWAKAEQPVAAECGRKVALAFQLLGGRQVRVDRLRGKVVVLDFWASWCGPCIKAIPELKQFYAQRKADGNFTLVSLSLDGDVPSAQGAIRRLGMDWPQAMDGGRRRKFHGNGIPHAAVISPAGHIIWQGHPGHHATLAWRTDFARRQAARMAERAKATKDQADKDKIRPKTDPQTGPRETPTTRPRPAEPTDAATKAQQRYALAKTYLQAGLTARARALLEEVVKTYPGTPAAAKAAADLKDLP